MAPQTASPTIAGKRRATIRANGLTLELVSRHCGVNYTFVSHVISGRRLRGPMSNRVMGYLSGATGVPTADLFPDADKLPMTAGLTAR
jgi:transcriptional regulator with XRE-family HTH domain